MTRAGYNLLNSRGVSDTSSIRARPAANRLTCQTWSPPQAAGTCNPRARRARATHLRDLHQDADHAGVGLTPVIAEEYETKLQALQGLVTGSTPMTVANLEAAGSNRCRSRAA